MTTLISGSVPVAKKDHKCDYCGGMIKKGEKYNRDFLIYDFPYSWKYHIKCGKIASKLDMFDDCDEGVTKDDFHEYIKYEYSQLYEKMNPNSFETDPIPDFFEQLDYVCDHHLKCKEAL